MAELRKWLLEGPPALRVILVALVAGLVCVGAAVADTYIWDQNEDGVWSVESNWTTGAGCPSDCYPHTAYDDAIIEDVGGGNDIKLDDDYAIESLTFTDVGEDDNHVESNNGSARELTCGEVVLIGGATGESEVFVWDNVSIITQ